MELTVEKLYISAPSEWLVCYNEHYCSEWYKGRTLSKGERLLKFLFIMPLEKYLRPTGINETFIYFETPNRDSLYFCREDFSNSDVEKIRNTIAYNLYGLLRTSFPAEK